MEEGKGGEGRWGKEGGRWEREAIWGTYSNDDSIYVCVLFWQGARAWWRGWYSHLALLIARPFADAILGRIVTPPRYEIVLGLLTLSANSYLLW